MKAYHGSQIKKDAILAQLLAHADADELVKGQYWQGGKGCAVGCTIHSSDHELYESRFGIPQMLARLEDCIFEGLPNGAAKDWPLRFMSAIQPGADLSLVGWKFLHWLLTDPAINPGIEHPLVAAAVRQCADLLIPLTKGLSADASAARSAADAVRSAAWSAASAEWSAAWSAESAASAANAVSAAWSAESAASAANAVSAAWSEMAEMLITLLKTA